MGKALGWIGFVIFGWMTISAGMMGFAKAGNDVAFGILLFAYIGFGAWAFTAHYVVGHRKHRTHLRVFFAVYFIAFAGFLFNRNGGPFILLASLANLFIIWKYLLRADKKPVDSIEGGGEILRGTRIVDTQDILKNEQKPSKKQDKERIKIGGITIPRDAETSHFLFAGGPGTGKSVAISAMLESIRNREERAIVYDQTGEFLAQFYRAGDVILNPLDARSAAWTPWADASSRVDYEQIASSIIPDDEKQPFFPQSARALLVSILEDVDTVDELTRMIMGADSNELIELVKQKGMAGLVGSGQIFANSRASMTSPTTCLRYLKNAGNNAFSIKKWVANEQNKGWLFLTSRADQRTVLRPLLTLWLDLAVTGVMMLQPDRNRRIWLFVDELPSLQKMPKIGVAQAECRKYGLGVVTGIQSIAQLREIYGRDGAEALLGLPQTQTILRLPDPDTAAWASRAIGERHIVRKVENESASAQGGSSGTSQQHATEAAILPSQIQNLPSLQGILKYPGRDGVTVARIKLEIKDRSNVTESYVPLPVPVQKPEVKQDDQ